MPTMEPGDPDNFPEEMPKPSDGDGPGISAADVNPAIEANADRTAWLRKRGFLLQNALRASDFPTLVAGPAGLTSPRADYGRGRWWACGGEDWFASTPDPYNWPTATEISGGAQWGDTHITTFDFDVSPAGAIVVTNVYTTGTFGDTFVDKYQERTAAGTWTKQAATFGAGVYFANVRYAVTAARWCVAAKDENNKSSAFTTADPHGGGTWTQHFIASIPDSSILTLAHDGAGVLVIQAFNGTHVYFSRSTDGGLTWSAAVDKALAFTPIASGDMSIFTRPVWNGSVWMAVASNVGTCKVWTSPDGAVWTEVASFGTGFFGGSGLTIESLDVIAETFVALASDGTYLYLLVSQDAGVTWKRSDRAFKAGGGVGRPGFLAAGPERFLLSGINGKFWPGSPVAGASIQVAP